LCFFFGADICGFTTVAKSVEPHEIMEWLNILFSRLDGLTGQFKVHKVRKAQYLIKKASYASTEDSILHR